MCSTSPPAWAPPAIASRRCTASTSWSTGTHQRPLGAADVDRAAQVGPGRGQGRGAPAAPAIVASHPSAPAAVCSPCRWRAARPQTVLFQLSLAPDASLATLGPGAAERSSSATPASC
jgi:hypothetical protein